MVMVVVSLLLHASIVWSAGASSPPPTAASVTPATKTAAETKRPAEAWAFENPFATAYASGPSLFRVGLHVGSVHRDGIGPSVTLVPWEYLRATVTYGYRTQHSAAGLVSVPIFPRALITPYVTAGYALGIAALPQGIRLFSHQLVAGLGLEARVLDRYVIGGEMTGNWIFRQTLREKTTTHLLEPGIPLSVQGGFHVGVQLP